MSKERCSASRRMITAGAAASIVLLISYAAVVRPTIEFAARTRARVAIEHLEQIVAAEARYHREHGRFASAELHPPDLRRVPATWNPQNGNGFLELGWSPEGDVVCQYGIDADESGYTVEIGCDRLGFDEMAFIGYVESHRGETGIRGPFGRCTREGVELAGPCDESSRMGWRLVARVDRSEP